MSRADADPDYFHQSFRRKGSDTFDRQEKRAKLNCSQFFAQRKFDIIANLREKTESEMDLIDGTPSNAANPRIKLDQNIPDRLRRIDGNEEPAELHFRGRISAPDCASLPLSLTCAGSERLKICMRRAIRFGNIALAAMMKWAVTGMTRFGLPRRHAFRIFRAARSTEMDAKGSLFARVNQR